MAYSNNIPLSTDTLTISQGDLLGNFVAIQSLVNIDHYTFNTGANFQGKHRQVTLPVLAVAPNTLAGEMALYTKNVTGVPQLFVRRDTNGVEINLTSATAATNGTTTLPSGIIIKWGSLGVLAGNVWTAFTFPVAFPNNCFSVQLTPQVITPAPSTAQTTTLLDLDSLLTVNGFNVFNRRTDAGGGYNSSGTYFAIGN